MFSGTSPFNDGTQVETIDGLPEGFPIDMAPERPEEFAPGLTPELLQLVQATAEMEITAS